MSERRKSPVIPLVVAAVAGLLLIVSVVGATRGGDDQTPSAQSSQSSVGSEASEGSSQDGSADNRAPDATWDKLARREPNDPMALGDADAPVVMLAYSEFQCPVCGKFARDTEPALIDQYVEEGTLRIEWRDFPYLGPESGAAAEAGRAAAAQGKFWEFHDAMYADQQPPNSGKLTEGYFVGVAEQIGLDVDQFRSDLGSTSMEQDVAADFAEGQSIGVTGTPAFVINGVPVIGAQPTEVFENVIDEAVEEAGR